ncbi:MAG TPA: hypothetical protein VJZ25_09215 [Gemmatimonadaceae bacterium]|nr:hypothetical protein [Gemmatimonadaceae bacterium]
MKPNRVLLTLVIGLITAATSSGPASAQDTGPGPEQLRIVDSTKIQVMTMRDGSSLVGRIVAIGADSVDFQTGIGRVPVAIRDVREIRETDSDRMKDGRYWFPNPNVTRLFFAPTGQMLKKGEGYFADYQLFFPGVAFGLTDNISIGGGVSIFPAGIEDQVYYVTPKVGGSFGEKVHLAAGVLFAGTKGGTGGVGYGVGTIGDGDASATLGLGYGFAGGEIESRPVAMLGGEKRVSRRIALVTENYLLPISDNNIVYSFGLRFMGEKLTTDLAIFNVSGSGIIGLPFVDFVFRF